MTSHPITLKFDSIIRFLIYLLIFWLPYSPAVIETSVVVSLLLWVTKRSLVFWAALKGDQRKTSFLTLLLRSFRPVPCVLDIPIALFIITCLFSLSVTSFFPQAIKGFLAKTMEWFTVFYLILEVFKTRRQIQIALGILLFTAFSSAFDGIVQYHVTGKDFFYGYLLNGSGATAGFKHYNNFGGYLTFLVPIVLALAIYARRVRTFILFGILFSVITWSAVITFSRGAWIGILIGSLLILFLRNRKIFLTAGGVLIGGFLLFYIFAPQELQKHARLDWYQIQETALGRKELWTEAFPMILQKPFFGHGPNTFMLIFQSYRITVTDWPTYAHNCYIQLASEVGLMGLGAFLFIIIFLGKRVLKTISKTSQGDVFLKSLAAGTLAGALAFLIHSFFDTNLYSLQLSVHFWAMVGMLVVVDQLLCNSPMDTRKP